MSLLRIMRKIWKYKLLTLPVLLFVLAGTYYVMAVKAPTYEAGSTYILVNPPSPPTESQILRDPSLGRIDADNPYLRFSDQSVMVQVLASRLKSKEVRRRLAEQGADPNYVAAPSPEFGFSAPILQITGTGTSQAAAVRTADLVGRALTHELDRMQQIRGVAKDYRVTTEAVVTARDATLKASGKLRALVAVFALGTILLFIVISVLDGLSALRAEWAQGLADDETLWAEALVDDEDSAVGESVEPPVTRYRDALSLSDPDPDAPQWPLEAQR